MWQVLKQILGIDRIKITRLPLGLSAVLLTSVVLSACSETPGADQISAISEQTQINAHAACKAEQGSRSGAAIEILELGNGRVVASTLNGNGVTLAQARAVNQCAQAKLLGARSTAVVPVQSRPIADQGSKRIGQAGCLQGGGVLQGGLRLCPGY